MLMSSGVDALDCVTDEFPYSLRWSLLDFLDARAADELRIALVRPMRTRIGPLGLAVEDLLQRAKHIRHTEGLPGRQPPHS